MINATVTRVIDGDTVEVEVSKLKIRLDFVDAPETKGPERPKGLITKDWLKNRIEGKEVQIDIKDFDMYGRGLSTIYLEGSNINGELIKEKLVEIYSPANHDDGKLDV